MFKTHPSLTSPPDDTVLWRYIDFPKFISVLAKQQLYFVSLSNLNDPFEGHVTRPTVDQMRRAGQELPHEEKERWQQITNHNLNAFQQARGYINVSCWHMNDSESDAMWNLYMPSGQGIAIRTTFSRFREALADTQREVNGSIVKYLDYDSDEVDWTNLYNFTILKRLSFEHEKEFRGLVTEPSNNGSGVEVEANISTLIESIFISPMAPDWHAELVRDLVKTYGFDIPVHQSKLYERPTYYDAPATQ